MHSCSPDPPAHLPRWINKQPSEKDVAHPGNNLEQTSFLPFWGDESIRVEAVLFPVPLLLALEVHPKAVFSVSVDENPEHRNCEKQKEKNTASPGIVESLQKNNFRSSLLPFESCM